MFTGIITAVGTVSRSAALPTAGSSSPSPLPYRGLVPGESIAVDGACLTVARARPGLVRGPHHRAPSLDRTAFGDVRGRATG